MLIIVNKYIFNFDNSTIIDPVEMSIQMNYSTNKYVLLLSKLRNKLSVKKDKYSLSQITITFTCFDFRCQQQGEKPYAYDIEMTDTSYSLYPCRLT